MLERFSGNIENFHFTSILLIRSFGY